MRRIHYFHFSYGYQLRLTSSFVEAHPMHYISFAINLTLMGLTRRKFLHISQAAALGLPFIPQTDFFNLSSKKNKYVENIGLQLYTVRDQLVYNPMKTLETIRNLGYKQVELFDVHLLRRMKPALDNLGLATNSAHFMSAFLTGNWDLMAVQGIYKPNNYTLDQVVADAAKYGVQYLVLPYFFPSERDSLEKCQLISEKMNQLGEKCQQAGLQLCYHNHASEFKPLYDDDTVPFEVFMQEFDKDLVKLELDIFWLKVAGLDPAQKIEEYAGRVELLHLKDKASGIPKVFLGEEQFPEEAFQPIGEGEIDFNSIFKAAKKAKVQHCFVEQDASPNPMQSISESIRYLQNNF